jgi:probable rRNA maturation factor
MKTIHFFKEDIRFTLRQQKELRQWIQSVIHKNKFHTDEINFIFCSDPYLLKLNKKFLQHDYYTDIITFDNSTQKKTITGDIFISYDRVKDNSNKFDTTFKDELHRVMIHGILHLIGFTDNTAKKKAEMRKLEEACLAMRKF